MIKNRITRIAFWFNTEDERLHSLGNIFFSISTLLTRLSNELYEGKKIKFINIFFATKEKYAKYVLTPIDHVHYSSGGEGHMAYHALFDLNEFTQLNHAQQVRFLWEKAHVYLQVCAKTVKNEALWEVAEYAYRKGLDMNLNPDFQVVETEVLIQGKILQAAVWIKFDRDEATSTFVLEDQGKVIFEKVIYKTATNLEYFLEVYKSIGVENDYIVIKGRKDAQHLPFNIPVSTVFVNL